MSAPAPPEKTHPDVLAGLAPLFDALPDAVLIANATGAIVYVNPAAQSLLDLSAPLPEAAATRLQELRDPDGQPLDPLAAPLARALRGEVVSSVPFVLPRTTGDDEDLYLGISFAPIVEREGDGTGQPQGAILYAADRTIQRRIERTRDDFLATVSHDLRSPLTTIRGAAQLALRWAQRELPAGTPLQRTLQNIDAAAVRLNRMLETLLDSARLARGRLALQRAPTDLVALIEEVVAHYRRESPRHELVLEAPAEPLVGDWDAALLERAIENLVGNAIKYSPQGGRVTVVCAEEDGLVRVSVRDQGVGIPAEALPYVFNQFFRAKNARFGEIEGSGLGLFAVKGIVTAHGGTIDVSSVEGEGTEFTLRLPRTFHGGPEEHEEHEATV